MVPDPTIYDIMASVATVVIALASLITVYIAYKALSIWKEEHVEKTTYNIAYQCMGAASTLHIGLIIDRISLQMTDTQYWFQILNETKRNWDVFTIRAMEAQRHFGKDKIGSPLKKISDLITEFSICTRMYPSYKNKQSPYTDPILKKLVPSAKVDEYYAVMKEIFESDNPREDEYNQKIQKAIDDLEQFLSPYLNL